MHGYCIITACPWHNKMVGSALQAQGSSYQLPLVQRMAHERIRLCVPEA